MQTGRAVRVKSQLKSHKRFSIGFQNYCQLVDIARLYSTNVIGQQPKVFPFSFVFPLVYDQIS